MSDERPTLAAVVRAHGERFRRQAATSVAQRRALADIAACRTQALGGHLYQCEKCGHRKLAYNPCGNRHCPQCQAAARAEWLDKRTGELLPVAYFHVVFTLPHQLRPLALQNPAIVYGILFRAAAQTLLELSESRLAARCGLLAVLHTWGQTLEHHPHLHC
ncbi:MAG: transposase zinc-binding domain-containing protein, partial [Acidobacteria bacterium]|nr:transposase zinc-binding domain-containing protein [Acidobacteriota bacterium]